MPPLIAGGVAPCSTSVWRTMAPEVFALRSIAIALAPLAAIVPLFSISPTPPERSTIAVALPLVPPLAEIVPLLRIALTLAP